jgi:hypothetical protein
MDQDKLACCSAAFVVDSPKVKVLGGSNSNMRTIITSSRNHPLSSLSMTKNSKIITKKKKKKKKKVIK